MKSSTWTTPRFCQASSMRTRTWNSATCRGHSAGQEYPCPTGSATLSPAAEMPPPTDRKSTRLNSSHTVISYAVFCLKKKKPNQPLYPSEHDSHIHKYIEDQHQR